MALCFIKKDIDYPFQSLMNNTIRAIKSTYIDFNITYQALKARHIPPQNGRNKRL